MHSNDNQHIAHPETQITIKDKFAQCTKLIGDKLDNTCESNYQIFAFVLIAGVFLFVLSLFFLPAIIISPSKFSMCFCVGSLFIISSFFFVKKPSDYLGSLCSGKRMLITVAYLGSVVLTFLACIVFKSYFLALPASIVQFLASLWIVCSFFPGGAAGMSIFTKCVGSCCRNIFGRLF